MNKILNYLKFFLGWPLTLISLYFIFSYIGPKIGNFIPQLFRLNPFLFVLGLFCLVIYFFIRSYLWQKILREQGYNVGIIDSIFLWGISEMKRYVPGNIWSFLGRVVSFEKRGVPKKVVLKSLLFEIEYFVIGCLVVSLLGLPFLISNFYVSISVFSVLIVSLIFIFSYKLKGIKIVPPFNAWSNLNLLLISIVSLIFFGLGNYFIASSIFAISLEFVRQFLGIFVFALLVGFLSIVTPMGLGVREYVLTLSLSSFLTTSVAGLLSIYTRIALIFSEIIFITLALVFYLRKDFFIKIFMFISNRKHEFLLLIFIVLYFVYFTYASFLRFDNFYTGRFDLGNMDQVVWNTINGRVFEFTNPDGTNVMSRLGFHADFILVLLSPFYLLWSSPKMLLLIQSLVLSLGAIFVYLISNYILKNKNESLVFSLSYLFYPAIQFTNLYDFHGVTLATTFFLGSIYFMLKKRLFLFVLFLILAALTKEQIWIISSIFGLFILIKGISRKRDYKNVLVGSSLFIFSLVIFYLLIFVAIPQNRGSEHFALQYFSEYGSSPSSVLTNLFLSPLEVLRNVFDKEGLDYIYQLFIPLGFLSIFSPFYLIFSIPEFLINLVSNNEQLHQIYYQYSAALTPFIFVSSIFGVLRIKKFLPEKFKGITIVYLMFFMIYGAYTIGPFPGAKNPNIDMFIKPVENKETISEFISSINSSLSVSASNNLGAHFSQRRFIYTIPNGVEKADVIAFLLNNPGAQPSPQEQQKMIEDLISNGNYEILINDGDFIAFRKINR